MHQPPNSGSHNPDYFWHQSLTFISQALKVAIHKHRCMQLIIGLHTQFDCAIQGQELVGLNGLVVNQNIPHACLVQQGEVLVSFIEADSFWGNYLRTWLAGKPYARLDHLLTNSTCEADGLEGETTLISDARLHVSVDKIMARIFSADSVAPAWQKSMPDEPMDSRLMAVMTYIEQHVHQRLTLESIADQIYLSPERVRHWFTTQTGIPLSQYILWHRLKQVLWAVIREQYSLAEACIKFGFVDQPHFNRLFKQNIGIAPQGLIKHCRLVE